MARYTGPVCRLCRREGTKLFLKGTKCLSDRCPIEKRNFPPGQHGQSRKVKKVVGYGAPGKGNTLLNYCGIRTDFIDFTVDRSPYKQGKFLPGSHIPIHAPDKLREARADYVLILPWNFKEEIVQQLADVRAKGTRLVVPIPETRVLD